MLVWSGLVWSGHSCPLAGSTKQPVMDEEQKLKHSAVSIQSATVQKSWVLNAEC
jgi:hypothetical protein